MVSFTVLGIPQGKARARTVSNGNRSWSYTPEKTVSYENLIKLEYRRQCNDFSFADDAQLDARIYCYYDIPKSVSKKKRAAMLEHKIRPKKKPDADNVVKVVLDALNKIAYRDDTQVVDCQVRKFYSETPRIVVKIQESKPIRIMEGGT